MPTIAHTCGPRKPAFSGTESEMSKPSSLCCITTTLQRYFTGGHPEVHGRSYGNVRVAARAGCVNEPESFQELVLGPDRGPAVTRRRGRSPRAASGPGTP